MYLFAYHGKDRLGFRIIGTVEKLSDLLLLVKRHVKIDKNWMIKMIDNYGVCITSNNFFILNTEFMNPSLPSQWGTQNVANKKLVEQLTKIAKSHVRLNKLKKLIF